MILTELLSGEKMWNLEKWKTKEKERKIESQQMNSVQRRNRQKHLDLQNHLLFTEAILKGGEQRGEAELCLITQELQ